MYEKFDCRSFTVYIFSVLGQAQSLRGKIDEGNEKYEQELYEEALNRYQDALLEDPKSDVVNFNRGDALYKMEKYDKALEAYQSVLGSKDLSLVAKAYHNIGNSFFKQDKLQESIDAYKKALDLNPEDQDTKYNLELARAKLKEMADKQQQPQKSGQQQQQQKQGEQGEQQDNREQQGSEDKQQSEQKQGDEQQQEKQQQEQQHAEAEKQESGEKMDKEDAQRILDALKNEEQNNKDLRKPVRSRRKRVDKDW